MSKKKPPKMSKKKQPKMSKKKQRKMSKKKQRRARSLPAHYHQWSFKEPRQHKEGRVFAEEKKDMTYWHSSYI